VVISGGTVFGFEVHLKADLPELISATTIPLNGTKASVIRISASVHGNPDKEMLPQSRKESSCGDDAGAKNPEGTPDFGGSVGGGKKGWGVP
jgi:hypothetical protein